jgi:uncharacterized Zn finger protein
MSWFYDYRPTIETDEGIKAKSKRGDFVKNWWATRWIQAMEQVMDRGRLQRGRRYTRKGQVLSLEVGQGTVSARVQGSRPAPYKVMIELETLGQQAWAQVLGALAKRPYFVAQLLAGEMPQEVEQAFAAVKLNLFPKRHELLQECSCPDWVAVCKHLAAVHYILGERLDEDPFLLLRLRGRTRDAIPTALGSVANVVETEVAPTYVAASSLHENLDAFWQIGPELESFAVHFASQETPYPLLEQLGDPDFLPEVRRWLARVYDGVTEAAMALAYPVESEEEDET